jgi:DNA-binding response OmpR family regulator
VGSGSSNRSPYGAIERFADRFTGPCQCRQFARFRAPGGHSSYRLSVLEVQDVRIDPSARRVWRADREIVLSRKEYDLLHALASRPGDIVSRDELMRDVWGASFWTSSKTIDVHLGWVRRKLGDDSRRPVLISTIRGRGLRFETAAPVASVEV